MSSAPARSTGRSRPEPDCRPMSPDYRDTVFLPRTEFPMKAGLPQREPGWVERWERMDLYARLRRASLGRDKFLLSGELYRGKKSVMWSVVEKTALADAEVEYHEHASTSIVVRFPIDSSSLSFLTNASILIWTTTPWTIPANRAIAYGTEI